MCRAVHCRARSRGKVVSERRAQHPDGHLDPGGGSQPPRRWADSYSSDDNIDDDSRLSVVYLI